MEADFWSDPNAAQKTIRRLNAMKEVVDAYDALDNQLSSLQENDEDFASLISQIGKTKKQAIQSFLTERKKVYGEIR